MDGPEQLQRTLRLLAVEDPREARRVFLRLLDSGDPGVFGLLDRLASPADGRLRQIVANASRNRKDKGRLAPYLFAWQEFETDEFTRRAIVGALDGVEKPDGRATPNQISPPISRTLDMYRYVSDRLRHRLRNAMVPAQVELKKLRALSADDSAMQTAIDGVGKAVVALGREVEATDVDPAYFDQRVVGLQDWLKQMNTRYAMHYASIRLTLHQSDSSPVRLLGSDYLLELVFWNIWLNAQQAIGPNCEIVIELNITPDNKVALMILDNGDGIPSNLQDIVFQQEYSTREQSRGRGLLEVQDAAERLHGRIKLVETAPGSCRIHLTLPVHAA